MKLFDEKIFERRRVDQKVYVNTNSCSINLKISTMTFYKQPVFVFYLLVLVFRCGEPQEIIELPKEVPATDVGSTLPQSVQSNGTNSSSLPDGDSTRDLSSTVEPPSTGTNPNTPSATISGTSEQPTTTPNPTANNISILNTSIFENATLDANLTTTLSADDVFQNDTLDFTNSTLEPSTDPPQSETESPDFEDDLSVRQTMFLDDYCSCDIKVDSCDIGCCCDGDCSFEDRRAFATCLTSPRPLAGDSRYCMQKWVLQRHNTEYTVDTTNPSLFCITSDNLVQRTSFPPLKVIKTPEDFQKLSGAARRGVQSSSGGTPATASLLPANKPYQHGDFVWGVSYEGSLFPIGLPSTMFTSSCEADSKLRYLTDFTSECQRQVRINLKQSHEKSLHPSSYTNFYVLIQPSLLFEQKEEVVTTTTTAPTESTLTSPFTSPPATPSDVLSNSSTTTGTSSNNSSGPSNSPNDTSTTNPTAAPETSGTGSATLSTSSTVTNTHQSTVGVELTPSSTISSENQANSTNLKARLESSETFVFLEDEPPFFNDTLLCEVRVTLCFGSHEIVCHDASQHKSPLTECDVVTEVNYVIYHNGSEGIKSVTAKVSLRDICLETRPQSSPHQPDESFEVELNLKQKFTVEYQWAQDKEIFVRDRSGRPGYLRGKPLLLGRIVHNITEEGFSVHAIAMNPDPMEGLTVLRGSATGDCTARTPVMFGENLQTHCRVQVTPADIVHNCTLLRERIRNELLGDILSDGDDDLRIAMYGDSDVLQVSQWVPLLRTRDTSRTDSGDAMLEEGRCSDLVVAMRLEVAFALQGSLASPQAKVVGALLTEGPVKSSPPVLCVGPFCPQESLFGSGTPHAESDNEEQEGSGHSLTENQKVEFTQQESSSQAASKNASSPPLQKLTRESDSSTKTAERLEFEHAEYKTSTFLPVAIELSTTVVFIDVTEPSEPAFPGPPHLDIKLPENFFYPLVPPSSSARLRVCNLFHSICFSIVLFLLMNLRISCF